MKLTGYRSPGRKATAQKLRAIAESKPTAINCPELFAEDKEFMRLFWASKAIEHNRKKRVEFVRLKNQLRARGIWLESRVQPDGSFLLDANEAGAFNKAHLRDTDAA